MENHRAGSKHRINPDRLFHVMNQGWFIFTREGIQGPYDKRDEAETYISTVSSSKDALPSNDDNNNSWRM